MQYIRHYITDKNGSYVPTNNIRHYIDRGRTLPASCDNSRIYAHGIAQLNEHVSRRRAVYLYRKSNSLDNR